MRTIVHLSDLHFGRIDPGIPDALARDVAAVAPDLVVVSGDLTQRARRHEFRAARAFLETLPKPQIVVPGNHDIPLYNVLWRLFRPLARYRAHISDITEPFYADAEMAIAGINTARSLTFKNGRVSEAQVATICGTLRAQPDGVVRIVVTHHPFETAARDEDIVGRAAMAMAAFARCRIDLILSGHLHVNRIASSAARYRIGGRAALLLQAGTATSSRRRDEPNSYNVIRIDRGRIGCECWTWPPEGGAFVLSTVEHFVDGEAGWSRDAGEALPEVTQLPSGVVAMDADGEPPA